MVNLPRIGYNSENGVTLKELPETKITDHAKRKLLFKSEKKESNKQKSFQKLLE